MKKREQFQEEKRVHRAQEMERMNTKVRPQGGHNKSVDVDNVIQSPLHTFFNSVAFL